MNSTCRRTGSGLPCRAALLAGLACLGALASARAATVEVTVEDFRFSPAVVSIQPGDTVVWRNTGGGHNVVADDGSFSSGPPSAAAWTFSHTFSAAGSFPYHCEPHRSLGMTGSVQVAGGSGGQAGVLRLENTSYSVPEGGSLAVRALRLNGDDGAVSVTWTFSAGTAQSSDFVAETGTLSWPDGDGAPRSFTVRTRQDNLAEGNETLRLTLSGAGGGAVLDASGRSATVTIQDDDSGGGPPTAPSGLVAHAHSTSEILLTWNDAAAETRYRIESRTPGQAFQPLDTVGEDQTSVLVGGLAAATLYTFRVRAENAAGASAWSAEVSAATDAAVAPCVPAPTVLCLNEQRFQAEVRWRTATDQGQATAVPLEIAPDSGLFYFFSPGNIEMLVKVLDACVPVLGNRYWIFYAATTNVELTLTVIDTRTGKVRVYHNPLRTRAEPVQDTDAFATCP